MTTMNITIRSEARSDYTDISLLNDLAFGRENEASLVEKLRKNPLFRKELSLVALFEGQAVGHILFFPVVVKGDKQDFSLLCLAPMAVMPEFQGMGIGGKLIEIGFKTARKLGYRSIYVLGHADYYPRFGFKPAGLWNIKAPFEAPDENSMAIELEENALLNKSGTVEYPVEFNDV